jgi:hypothetical protein
VLGLLFLQNSSPIVQFLALLAMAEAGFRLIRWGVGRWHTYQAQQQRLAEEALRKEKQEIRKERDAEERTHRTAERERQAEQRRRAHAETEALNLQHQQEVEATALQQHLRATALEREAKRLLSLSTLQRREEVLRIVSQCHTQITPEEAHSTGILWTTGQEGQEQILWFLHEKADPLTFQQWQDLEAVRCDEHARKLALISFCGFSHEIVREVPRLPLLLVEPHLLALWAQDGFHN